MQLRAPESALGTPRLRRHPAFGLFCAYALFIVYATLLPFQFVTDRDALAAKARWINWNPARLVTGDPTPITDLVSNVALFVPLGIVGFYAQRRRAAAVALLRCTAAGVLLSTSVEVLQYVTPSRNPAVSDVLMNTLGAILGGALAALFQLQFGGRLMRRATSLVQREPLLIVLACYALVVLLTALVPFDIDPTIGWLKHAVRSARIDPWRDGSRWSDEIPELLQYSVLCGLAYQVAARLGRGGPARLAGCVLGAGILALGLELAQLLVRSRVASSRDVLAALAGAMIGTVAGWALGTGSRARHGWALVAIAYFACLAAQALQPFQFQPDWTSMRARLSPTALIPYSSYYYKANLAAVADFLEGLLGYAPLAFVLARLQMGRSGAGAMRPGGIVALLCALYGLLLEILQLAVPRRYPEISDVLTAALGGALGVYAWRWMQHLNALGASSSRPAPPARAAEALAAAPHPVEAAGAAATSI